MQVDGVAETLTESRLLDTVGRLGQTGSVTEVLETLKKEGHTPYVVRQALLRALDRGTLRFGERLELVAS